MKNHPILAAGLTLSLLCGGSSRATPAPSAGEGILHAPPLRLARPEWQPLTGQEIKSLLSDHVVVIESAYEPAAGVKVVATYVGGCPPTESFFADGRWEMGVCDRAYRIFKGRWFTEAYRGGERLCTEAIDRPKECRSVWRGAAVDQIIMSQQSLAGANELTDDFNPYRISPRDGAGPH